MDCEDAMDPDVIQKLTRIETQVESLAAGYLEMRKMMNETRTDVTRALDSTHSAHHRIDEFKRDVCWTIGASMTACGIFSSLLTWALGR
jgi:outer membrane murein-binding lipoprotein Lpp